MYSIMPYYMHETALGISVPQKNRIFKLSGLDLNENINYSTTYSVRVSVEQGSFMWIETTT